MKTTAVLIARFQTPFLHEGHLNLIDQISEVHRKVIIILGVCSVKGSRRNPFDYYTRERMIRDQFPNVTILPLNDHSSDNQWSKNIDALLKETFSNELFVLFGGRDSFIQSYSGKLETRELPEYSDVSATQIRHDLSDEVRYSEDFRAGINYAYQNTYAKVNATVDIAVVRKETQEVLLARKPGVTQWRFPGGFSDPTDDSFEQAALRELKEECGDIEVGAMKYVTSRKIDDWRYRKEIDKIITTLFVCELIYGTPVPADDIEELCWCKIEELESWMKKGKTVAEHAVLIIELLKFKN